MAATAIENGEITEVEAIEQIAAPALGMFTVELQASIDSPAQALYKMLFMTVYKRMKVEPRIRALERRLLHAARDSSLRRRQCRRNPWPSRFPAYAVARRMRRRSERSTNRALKSDQALCFSARAKQRRMVQLIPGSHGRTCLRARHGVPTELRPT